jgi:hypothetical protein
VAILSRSVREKDPHIRLAAAVTLARVEPGHADIVPALQRLLGRYPHFFIYAADTLIALGSKASPLAPQILPLLRHGNDDVSRAASRVLRRINPVATGKTWGAAGAPGAVPAKLDPLWDDLASADALCVDLAVWRLAGAGSAAVTLVRERLRMPTTLTPERIDQLIVDLDSRDFAKRQRASSELADAIEAAAPALRRVLAAKPTREQRRRIEALLLGLDPTRSTEQLRRLRTVRLLEEMDSSESRVLLKTLSRGDQRFLLTLEAKFALQRLEAR